MATDDAQESGRPGAGSEAPVAAQRTNASNAEDGEQPGRYKSRHEQKRSGQQRGHVEGRKRKGRGDAKSRGYERGGWPKSKRQRFNEDRNKPEGAAADADGGDATTPHDGGGDSVDATPSYMHIPFSAEEIAAEARRPKRKVAVLIGYAGTGYHGMQINHSEKTIEGDLFRAFVDAGAISKANASDPRKSSLMRCARTDKGVHAASNVISLKLIIDDDVTDGEATTGETTAGEAATEETTADAVAADEQSTPATGEKSEKPEKTEKTSVVERINSHLPAQIRVWDILRTNNQFNCYLSCDSRWYEYLMPSYALLPPHPDSFLGKKIIESQKETGGYDAWRALFADVEDFWEKVEEEEIEPILAKLDLEAREGVRKQLHAVGTLQDPNSVETTTTTDMAGDEVVKDAASSAPDAGDVSAEETTAAAAATPEQAQQAEQETAAQEAVRDIKTAYVSAKRRYRVSPSRLSTLQTMLSAYVGTHNFHNYTVSKKFTDGSSHRHIKSFVVSPQPIIIRDTEWLSLKVHGQSFMMHQIRKMVAMAVLLVRCGVPLSRLTDSYGRRRISIPKAPGLGLLLERPVFDVYSQKAVANYGRDPIDFTRYDGEIQRFKEEHIYRRMWDVEERSNVFHIFFNQLDNFVADYFLWLTAHGVDVAHEPKERGVYGQQQQWQQQQQTLEAALGDEDEEDPEGGEG